MSATQVEHTNGQGAVDVHPTYTSPTGEGEGEKTTEPTKPVQFRLPARRQFVEAAQRMKMTLKDAADLAAELLDRVTRDEQPESPAERKARLAAKAGGQS